MKDNCNIVKAFINNFEELEQKLKEVRKEQSEIDKQISVWYHNVEGSKITHVSQSHKFMMRIIPLLKRRRELKLENIVLTTTCDTLRVHIENLKKVHTKYYRKNDSIMAEMVERAIEGK